jgi:hypothetical protein
MGTLTLDWKPVKDHPSYGSYCRLEAQIRLSEASFDQFFNGRAGYRAQYYLSPEEGILFNRETLSRLTPVLRGAYERSSVDAPWESLQMSIEAPHSKIWIVGEEAAFNEADPNTLSPKRWVHNNAALGRRAPLPTHLMIDVKGSFIEPVSRDFFVDPLKLDRASDLFRVGFT